MLFKSPWKSATLRALRAAFANFVSNASDKGHFEVERKFALTQHEAVTIPARLQELGFTYSGTASMTDTFLPAAVAGEMMRVRQEKLGDEPRRTVLTFKKWVQTATGKERQETERQVGNTVGAVWKLIGRMVAGGPLLSFSKQRKLFDGKFGESDVVISVDRVEGLGEFSGFYMEVEVIVPLDGDVVAYRDRIFSLVRDILGEQRDDVRRSYMDMLVESRQVA